MIHLNISFGMYMEKIMFNALAMLLFVGSCIGGTFQDNEVVEDIDKECYAKVIKKIPSNLIEMNKTEQYFLNGLIRKYKPKKIVEIGVAKGGSSVVILNAIKDIPGAKLYSIDKAVNCYSYEGKKTGFLVEESFPELMDKWELKTGGITCDFIDEIGKDIDFVFIDTVHVTPGEMLEVIQIFPYLKKGAVLVFHDIGLYMTGWPYDFSNGEKQNLNFSNNLIFSYLKGNKMLPKSEKEKVFYNIGAVKLSKDQDKYLLDLFFPLSFHWEYLPQETDLKKIRSFVEKHYNARFLKMFDEAVRINKEFLKDREIHPGVKWMDSRYNAGS